MRKQLVKGVSKIETLIKSNTTPHKLATEYVKDTK